MNHDIEVVWENKGMFYQLVRYSRDSEIEMTCMLGLLKGDLDKYLPEHFPAPGIPPSDAYVNYYDKHIVEIIAYPPGYPESRKSARVSLSTNGSKPEPDNAGSREKGYPI
jgi:hypothetical protein